MKKTLWGILIVTGVILAFKIGNILIFDFNRLTEYGFGYLTGLTVLFLIVSFLIIFMGRKLFKKNYLPK